MRSFKKVIPAILVADSVIGAGVAQATTTPPSHNNTSGAGGSHGSTSGAGGSHGSTSGAGGSHGSTSGASGGKQSGN